MSTEKGNVLYNTFRWCWGETWMATAEVAKRLGMTPGGALHALNELESSGVLESRTRRYRRGGRGRGSGFRKEWRLRS